MLLYLVYLVMHGYFEQVTACFLVLGHTHIDADQIAVFSRALRRGTVTALSVASYVEAPA